MTSHLMYQASGCSLYMTRELSHGYLIKKDLQLSNTYTIPRGTRIDAVRYFPLTREYRANHDIRGGCSGGVLVKAFGHGLYL